MNDEVNDDIEVSAGDGVENTSSDDSSIPPVPAFDVRFSYIIILLYTEVQI